MSKARVQHLREIENTTGKIAELTARMVEITDLVLATDPWTREGDDARRLFRVCVKQLQIRADLSGDALIASCVYDALEKFKESCPHLFHE